MRRLLCAAGSSCAPVAIVPRCIGRRLECMAAVRRALYVGMIAALAAAAGGCVTPRSGLDHLDRAARIQADLDTGATFRHRIYRREALDPDASGVLHVYIEGDGQPFLSPTAVALDPTPREPLMLRLMALDPARSLYLGR